MEDYIYKNYGEGYEDEMLKKESEENYKEPFDEQLLNTKKINKYDMDEYFLEL